MRTSHAFHSGSMDPVLPEFEAVLVAAETRASHTHRCCRTPPGTWMTAEEATDPARWAGQIRATVKFSDELDVLLSDPHRVLVEVGPGGSLTGSASRQPRWSSRHHAVRLMRHQLQNRDDRDTFLLALGQLWSAGVESPIGPACAPPSHPDESALPGYPFARQRHWVEPKVTADQPDRPIPAETTGAAPRATVTVQNAPAGRQQQIEATLQRIWAESLGIESIDRNADFFELGGDSVSAIGIATNLAKEGLDLSPQDLFENHTVAALAAALTARYGCRRAG